VILSLLRSHTFDEVSKSGDGPVRCTIKEKYPFSAAANQTEDNINIDPESIAKLIDDQAKEVEAPQQPEEQQTEPAAANKGGKGGKKQKPQK
jgi:hypothetical protein